MASVLGTLKGTVLSSAYLSLAVAHLSSLLVTSSMSVPLMIQVTSSMKELPRLSSTRLSTAHWIEREEHRRGGRTLREARRYADGVAVLSVYAHDEIASSHEAVDGGGCLVMDDAGSQSAILFTAVNAYYT